ncbi:MAG: glutathione S-transferase family protein, partial [Alphaproteobacteria bacterium]
LLHKGLDFQTIPWRFTDKEVIAPSGSTRVPVITDKGRWIADSWQIALYLDETYPERPLMPGAHGRGLSYFVNQWCDTSVHAALRPLALLRVLAVVHEKDRRYFRESREEMLGMPLEEACGDSAAAQAELRRILSPAENTLENQAFLGGEEVCYGDYALFGSLKWLHAISGDLPLDAGSAIRCWFDNLLDMHDGHARKALTVSA